MSTRQQPRPLCEMLRPPKMSISEADMASEKEQLRRRRDLMAQLLRLAVLCVALFGWLAK